MKKCFAAITFIIVAHLTYAQQTSGCNTGVNINSGFSKAAALDSIMKRYTANALPGIAIAVYTEKEGWWSAAHGYARVEDKTPMNNCHLQYLQSVAKTYMAVEILQLKEQGRIRLDAPITDYLPAAYSSYIKDAGRITVRMLLNQTSGVPEYNTHPAFVSRVVQHPLRYFTAKDCLETIENEPPKFAPGARYEYTNTNYLLLSLIGDAITRDHAAFIQKNIFKPLGLKNTYYGKGYDYLKGLNVPDSYWDMLNVGRPANITQFQQATVVSSKGDDGIVCTPVDAVLFLKGLMKASC